MLLSARRQVQRQGCRLLMPSKALMHPQVASLTSDWSAFSSLPVGPAGLAVKTHEAGRRRKEEKDSLVTPGSCRR